MKSKRVVVAISGGIAAYKSPLLIRLLVKSGCEVKVVTTKNALQFVTETTLRSVSKNPVYSEMFHDNNADEIEHISIADWADVFVVAPATANIIGKYANGIADDVLSTTLLAFTKKVFFAPAMNSNMYHSPVVQENIKKLEQRGVTIISPVKGELACGYVGDGKMVEPQDIFEIIKTFLSPNNQILERKTFLVTAGATYEKIDAVRFIGNYSSGKMGYAIAQTLASYGAKVKLIVGHISVELDNNPNIEIIEGKTAEQMYNAAVKLFPCCDGAILSAAVADYTPCAVSDKKIKKADQSLTLTLNPTKDILASLGKIKTDKQRLVGFALETDNEIENAKKKLHNKNLDFIVLNSLSDKGAGFATPTNKITIIDKDESLLPFPLKTKKEVALDIVNHLISKL
ncbi:MAG: bifunctional phosphopantothenoylcysteine decarboxylase/phosphopantothenate--cysteine ligase CoaBC [Bacteroidales bacterium]|jgi:phosphopantothenoylcysteine decarboxylase/phosphopantothenate--cysteine ligase|nr:bifunctional phosphopantothenoylcysteine decarboxylase/phosphopantothenate--cysteine ligase CoaBC [Bacteroidales bacterium]